MTVTEILPAQIDPGVLMRTVERERKARRIAEQLLEDKARELYLAREEVREQYNSLKQTQGQLVHSEKMASVGQLAAGVAHEINNPIGFVTSNVQTLTDYVDVFSSLISLSSELVTAVRNSDATAALRLADQIDELRRREDVDDILDDTTDLLQESLDGLVRVREIVQNLKSFVHLDNAEEQLADVNDGIDATLKIVWNELKYKCRVEKNYGDLPKIRCFAGELNQVFLNLLVNAAQAIEDSGVITIATEATEREVLVRISDTGRGIAQEHLNQLFDPFFTTKPVGQGTGLGLSVSYGIVQKHRGTICVDSTVGQGTTFTVRLPIDGSETGGHN
ncbi:MAG: ATP-binding protein [Planctomycetaceae bacterium]